MTKYENVMNEEQLEKVAGGNGIDRGKIISNLESRGLGEYLVKKQKG